MEWTKDERTRTVQVIYRCTGRGGCKAARRVAHTVTTVRTYRSDRAGAVSTKVTWTWPDGTTHVGEGFWSPQACACGRTMTGHAITGRLNADVVCDARCEGAVGHQCECSCGGKNHGRSHAA